MKKYIFTLSAFLLVILLPGCEKEFDGLVESGESTYKITSVNNFSEVNYGLQDSTVQFWLQLENDNDVSSVSCSLLDPDGEELEGSPVNLVKTEGQYSGEFTFSYSDIIGQYTANYYITDNASGTKLAASHYFYYDNGQENVAPVVSNLVAPDTAALDPENDTLIPLEIKAVDANGRRDIAKVFFNTYRPNGTITGNSPTEMFDDGDVALHGDEVAKDGVYSVIIRLPSSGVDLGTYRFEFQAQDRRGLLSEKLLHYLEIK